MFLLLPVLSFAQSDEPISLTATSTQTSPIIGQKFTVSISVVNTAYEDISGFLLAKGSSGLTIYDIEAMSGTSNQWTSNQVILAGKGGQKEIRFNAVGNEAAEAPITILFNYKHNGEERQMNSTIDIKVRAAQCGDGKCEFGESSENCCKDCWCSSDYKCVQKEADAQARCYERSFFDPISSFFKWLYDKVTSIIAIIFLIVVIYFLVKRYL